MLTWQEKQFKRFGMHFIKKLSVIMGVTIICCSANAQKVCLCFRDDFMDLLRVQERRYLTEVSKSRINGEMEWSGDPNTYMIEAMCRAVFSKNLGCEYQLGEMAYVYRNIQDEGVVFDESYCDSILKVLKVFLKKTIIEYRSKIFYYELSKGISEEECKECVRFMKFFKDYEDDPIKKLGTIFKRVSSVCLIQ